MSCLLIRRPEVYSPAPPVHMLKWQDTETDTQIGPDGCASTMLGSFLAINVLVCADKGE